ncbi:DEAD-box ATP-dependent RNA helicase DeaD (= CshA) [hydrothermal vent metagenome]|uniref:RNA helicase n=1 Tax=hydrothermal vent metagenome TaxID=652676 RepID=A0A3B0WDZ9_9ZZZZ
MSTDTSTGAAVSFRDLALNKSLLKILDEVGYEVPSPIQAQTIPLLLDGRDIIGQAQTGTGKTAAFALPLINNLDIKQKDPQLLVLAPTRELAIQVAEAFQKYATHIKGFHVLPIYGGSDYSGQIRALKRGVHVVVGTPGRVMDHIRKGTLKLNNLTALVLDEADEMLRMGFIDDVEWILEQTPDDRQIALFSATMPQQIRRIATKYLNNPEQVTIKVKTATAETIRQRFWPVSGLHKLDALTRILEAEEFDAMIIFVRTKNSTVELADKLAARGYAASPLNGDIAQNQRERTVKSLKSGKLDILVATDVAARGLDVERISHVVNYDVPHDTESYIHRIGRTGRAGREGDAILFVAPREKRMLFSIEKATRKTIERMELPSTEVINDKRIGKFKQRISDTLANEDLTQFAQLVEQYEQEHNVPAIEIASALAHLMQGDIPLLLQNKPQRRDNKGRDDWDRNDRDQGRRDRGARNRDDRPRRERTERSPRRERSGNTEIDEGMDRYRIEVGHDHQVKPGNIVGAIANEADIESKYIGRISIYDDYSTIDLPEDMPKELLYTLKKVWVSGQQLKISLDGKEEKAHGGNRSDSNKHSSDKEKPGKRQVVVNSDNRSSSDGKKGKLSLKKRVRKK